jgi:hypothetical protein
MKAVAIVLSTLLLGGCSTAPLTIVPGKVAPDLGPASLRLEQGMTEPQAIAAVGAQPDRAEVRTCGTTSGNPPWTCRLLYFSSYPHTLSVFFSESVDGTWLTNSWIIN